MGARDAARERCSTHGAAALDDAEDADVASGGVESINPLVPSGAAWQTTPAPGPEPAGPGESSGDPSEEELLLPCPTIEDDVRMVRAYEAIARQRAEYAPRYKACIEEVERLRAMRRYIFRQSRALAQQMLADTGPYAVDGALGEEGGLGPLSDRGNHTANEQPLPTKKRARLETEPGAAGSAAEAARCHTFGCTLSVRHDGVHRFDRFADPPQESHASEENAGSAGFDTHALLDVPIARVRDGLLHGLRHLAWQPHAAPFRVAPTAGVLACLDYVVAQLEGWVYTNAQQPFNDLDALWSGAISRCAPDSWTACYAHKLRGETETLRKATVQRTRGAAGCSRSS
jgi:hypothetical protein